MSVDIDSVLLERGRTHGLYSEHSRVSQAVKDVWRSSPGWGRLSSCQRETLEMVAHKVGRVLAGDPDFLDHWIDIAGYCALIEREIDPHE